MNVAVIGLGKLGACIAAVFASKGHNVIGADICADNVEKINAGKSPVSEPGLSDLVKQNSARLRASMNIADTVRDCEITFVIVPTPSDENGGFSLSICKDAMAEVGRGLAASSRYQVVVLTSTVLPGSVRYSLLPILEATSGKTCGVDFGVCYSPALIALGNVINEYLNPDFVMIGASDVRAADVVEEFFKTIIPTGTPQQRMTLENAELSKIALNTFVTMKITFANMLAALCEKIPGGDVDVVSDTIGLDKRIGRRYLTGGLSFGGPCFPRDNAALSYFSDQLGVESQLPKATESSNSEFVREFVHRLQPLFAKHDKVAVLGLAYKPNTSCIDASPGIGLANEFCRMGAKVFAYDPLANEMDLNSLDEQVIITDDLKECLGGASIVLITIADKQFKSLTAADFLGCARVVRVVDFWRILDAENMKTEQLIYMPAGRNNDGADAQARLAGFWSNA